MNHTSSNNYFARMIWTPSTVDFCEPNFLFSKYIAEPINTLSSLPLVLLGAFQIFQSRSLFLGKRFTAMGIALLFVGFGSFLFHSTLLFLGQLVDELAMVVAGVIFFLSFHFVDTQTIRYRNLVLFIGTLYCLFFLIIYLLFRRFYSFFVASFAFLVLTTFVSAWKTVGSVPNELGGKVLRGLFYVVLAISVCATLFWLPDTLYCEQTQRYHLHALWHLCGVIPPFLMWNINASTLHNERFRAKTGRAVNVVTGQVLSKQETAALVLVEDDNDPCNATDGPLCSPPRVPRLDWALGAIPFFVFKDRFE